MIMCDYKGGFCLPVVPGQDHGMALSTVSVLAVSKLQQ